MSEQQMWFTDHGDGRVTVNAFTPEMVITRELLESAQPRFLKRSWRMIGIQVSNGWARYRMVRRGTWPGTYACVLAEQGGEVTTLSADRAAELRRIWDAAYAAR